MLSVLVVYIHMIHYQYAAGFSIAYRENGLVLLQTKRNLSLPIVLRDNTERQASILLILIGIVITIRHSIAHH